MGATTPPARRRGRRRDAPGAPYPQRAAERAPSSSAARARVGARHRSTELMVSSISGRLVRIAALLLAVPMLSPQAQRVVIPMDDGQTNHLKAYGLTYNSVKTGVQAEWLLNYRGGAFLLPDVPELRRRAALDGISIEPVSDAQLAAIRREIATGNMESVPLEKAPRIAVYKPP